MVDAFATNRAVLHQSHGILTASRHSVDDAIFWFIAMDRCCHVQLLIDAMQEKPPLMSDTAAKHSATHVATFLAGYIFSQYTIRCLLQTLTCLIRI